MCIQLTISNQNMTASGLARVGVFNSAAEHELTDEHVLAGGERVTVTVGDNSIIVIDRLDADPEDAPTDTQAEG